MVKRERDHPKVDPGGQVVVGVYFPAAGWMREKRNSFRFSFITTGSFLIPIHEVEDISMTASLLEQIRHRRRMPVSNGTSSVPISKT
jgi:hypothetical protein